MSALRIEPLDGPLTLDRFIRHIDEISTLPHIAIRLMEVANDPNAGAADLKAVMESDPALSARVLRCVNSSAYAVRVKITNLQQAIAYLGMKQIRNLSMTASVSDLFRKDDAIGTYRRAELWRHLVAVGLCARLVAMRRKFHNFEDMFLAGLLHDIGIILEDQHAHPWFVRVIELLDGDRPLVEVESRVLGFDHTRLGEKVAEMWRFPDAVRSAIRHHHASVLYRGEDVDVVRCVEVANLLCSLKGMTSVGRQLVRLSPPVLGALSLTKEDIAVLAADLDGELARNASLFQA